MEREEANEKDSYLNFQEIDSKSWLQYVNDRILCIDSFVNIVSISSSENPIHFIGSERGLVLIANDKKQKCTRFVIRGFSDIISLSFHPQLHLLAVTGANKQLVICSLSEHDLCTSRNTTDEMIYLTPKANKYTTDLICKISWAPASTFHNENIIDHHLLTISEKGALHIWEYNGVNQLSMKTEFKEICGKVTNHVWCENSHVLTADCDGTIRGWEIERLPRINS